MARLIVLNGPPGIGKSTIARRYVEEHPLALALEQDQVRRLLGGWRTRDTESGLLARELCLSMARTHLTGGRDVVVPQLVAVPAYLDRLAATAAELHADYLEYVLMDSADAAEERFHARAEEPELAEHQRLAADAVEAAGGYRAEYDRLTRALEARPCTEVRTIAGDVDGTYAAVLACLHT